MQTSYGFSGLLCFSKTNTNSHSHSAPALYLTTRAEARVGGNSCRQSFRATRTSSVKCFKVLCQRKHAKTCQNMPPQCSCCQCTKLSRFVKNSVHAKVSSKKHATRLLLERALEQTKGVLLFTSCGWPRLLRSELLRPRCTTNSHQKLDDWRSAEKHRPRPI